MRLKGNRLWIYPLPSASTAVAATQHHRHCSPRTCDAGSAADNDGGDGRTCNDELEKWNDNDQCPHPSTTIGMLNLLIRNLPRMPSNVRVEELDISGIEITQCLADCIVRLLQFGNIRRLAILLCPCMDPNRIRNILFTALKYNKETLQQLEWQETPNTSPPPRTSLSPMPQQTAAALSHADTEGKNTSEDFDDLKIQSTRQSHHHQQQHYHISTVRLNIRISYQHRRRHHSQTHQHDQATQSSSWFLNDLFTTTQGPPPTFSPNPTPTPPFLTNVQHLYLNGSCLDPPSLLRLGTWLKRQVHVLETLSLKWCRLEDDDVANLVSSFLPRTTTTATRPNSNDDTIALKVLDVAGNRCGIQTIKAIGQLMECPNNTLHTLDLSNQLLYNHANHRNVISPKVPGVLLKSPFTLEEEVTARVLSSTQHHMLALAAATATESKNNDDRNGGNEVDDESVDNRTIPILPLQELGRALQSPNCQLQKLRLSGNEIDCIKPLVISGTTTAGASQQPQQHVFCSHTLKSLDLSANSLSDEQISTLVCALLMQQQQARPKSLSVPTSINSPSLQELNVKANPFQGLGMARLLYLLQRHNTLASLLVEQFKWSLLIRAAVTYHDAEMARRRRQQQKEEQVKPLNTFHLPLPQLPMPNDIVYIMSTKLGTKQPRKIDVFDDVSIFPPPVRSPSTNLTLEWIQQEIQYMTNLNASGRQLLAWPMRNQFPLSLWPVVLERINRRFYSCCPESNSENDANSINMMEATRTSVSSDACILRGSYQANRTSTTLRRRARRRRCRGGADDDSNCGKTTAATVLYYFLRHGPALLENQYLFSLEKK